MIHYVDCGEALILPSNNTVNGRLLPDELHPNTDGYRIMAACLGPIVDNLVACMCPPLFMQDWNYYYYYNYYYYTLFQPGKARCV